MQHIQGKSYVDILNCQATHRPLALLTGMFGLYHLEIYGTSVTNPSKNKGNSFASASHFLFLDDTQTIINWSIHHT